MTQASLSRTGRSLLGVKAFKRISKDYEHVSFFLVNGEKSPEARKTVQIDNLPYFAVYKDGEFVEGKSMATEEAFRAFVEEHFGGAS